MKLETKKILKSILIRNPSFAQIVSRLKIIEDDSVGTACTNGDIVYYSPSFFATLSDEHKKFVFAHELCHIMLNHIMRSEGKNNGVWNVATDAVINANLENDGFDVREGSVEIEGAEKYNAEELYQIIMKKLQEKKQGIDKENKKDSEQQESSNESGQQNQSEKNEGASGQKSKGSNTPTRKKMKIDEIDETKIAESRTTHDMWEETVKQAKKSGQLEMGQSESEKEMFERGRHEKAEMLERLERECLSKMASLSSTEEAIGKGIGNAKKQINWKKILQAGLVKHDYDWRLSKKVKNGVIPYELRKDATIPTTEVLIDVSGSVSLDLVKAFLRQVKPLVRKTKLKVGCFNESFYGFVDVKSEKDIDNFRIPKEADRGKWTEDWDLAVRSFSKGNYINRIVFTDGQPAPGHFPEPDLKGTKVTWIVYGNDKFSPCCGTVINITADEIDQEDKFNDYD